VVCSGSGAVFLLGANIGGRKLSSMPNDNFLAPDWEVFTQQSARESIKAARTVPNPAPAPRAEAIAMVWEDGISLICWDGAKYAWAQLEW
jgi:hypothetical protein